MASARNTSDPNRPAYDNPVGKKGRLVVGNNVPQPKRKPARKASRPQSSDARRKKRDLDKKLGQQPPD